MTDQFAMLRDPLFWLFVTLGSIIGTCLLTLALIVLTGKPEELPMEKPTEPPRRQ